MEKVRRLLQEALRELEEGRSDQQEADCSQVSPKPGDKDAFLAWRDVARKALEKAFSKVQEKNLALNEALNAVGVNPVLFTPSDWTVQRSEFEFYRVMAHLEGGYYLHLHTGGRGYPKTKVSWPDRDMYPEEYGTYIAIRLLHEPNPERILGVIHRLDEIAEEVENLTARVWAYGACLTRTPEGKEVEALAEE